MRAILGASALCCGIFSMPEADASVLIHIDLTSQTMHVSSDMGSYDWKVSTARSGYRTPSGTYRPSQLLRMHYSHKYHMSPMPYSIFFAGGYAIHGTYETASLGRPVSHGCIRLAPGNAARLFHLVQGEGAKITISGAPPRSSYYARLHRRWRGVGTGLCLVAPETSQRSRLRADEACASRDPDLAGRSHCQVAAAMANVAVRARTKIFVAARLRNGYVI